VANDGAVLVFAPDGTAREPLPGAREVTAVRRIGGLLVLGFTNGNIQLGGGAPPNDFAFADVPSTPGVALRAGPPGTLIAGYANGLVGLWALDNGARLFATRLHGPIAHVVVDGNTLYAASELGDHAAVDLTPFTQDRCALLQSIWRTVPIEWEAGL